MTQLPPLPRLGIQIDLNAPGLAVDTRPASESAYVAAETMKALGMTGDAISMYRTAIDRQEAEKQFRLAQTEEGQAKIARDREKRDAAAVAFDEGLAERFANEKLPTMFREVVAGEVEALKGDGDPAEKAAAYVATFGLGQSDAFKARLRDRLVPRLVEAQEQRRATMRAAAIENGNALLADNLKAVESPTQATMIIAAARNMNPDASALDIASSIVRPAMDFAAEQGDVERVRMFRGMLKEHLPQEQERAETRAAEVIQRREHEAEDSIREQTARFWTAGRPFAEIDTFLRDDGLPVSEVTRDRLLQENDARSRRFEAETAALGVQVRRREVEAGIAGGVDELIGAGRAAELTDVEVPFEGGTFSKSRGDLLEEAFGRAFARIANDETLTPPQQFDHQIRLATLNDYPPPGWERMISSGATAMSAINIADPQTKQPIPASAVRGLALYTRVREASRPLADKLATGKVQEFYETAITLMDDPSVGANPEQALLAARRLLSSEIPTTIAQEDMNTIEAGAAGIADRFGFSDAVNTGEIQAEIVKHAKIQVRAGVPAERAVSRAIDTVERSGVVLHGWWSAGRNLNLPPELRDDLPAASTVIIEDFAARHGKRLGLSADRLTIRMDRDNGLWFLSDKLTGFPVAPTDGIDPSEHVFDAGVFRRRVDAIRKSGILAEIKKREPKPKSGLGYGSFYR